MRAKLHEAALGVVLVVVRVGRLQNDLASLHPTTGLKNEPREWSIALDVFIEAR